LNIVADVSRPLCVIEAYLEIEMIPEELKRIAAAINLDSDEQFKLRIQFGISCIRIQFGISCIQRVKGLLTDNQIADALSIGEKFAEGECSRDDLDNAATLAAKAAQSHAGSGSLDGSGNAAVSVGRGVAAALAGRALEASEYAAYASIYAYASYAVSDLSAYVPEQEWQITRLKELARYA